MTRRRLRGLTLVSVVVVTAIFASQAAAAPVTKVYSSGSLSLPIEDSVFLGPGLISLVLTDSTIAVPDEGTVIGVKARIRSQARDRQQRAVRRSVLGFARPPGGRRGETSALISSKLGDFGAGAADCSGTPAVLDDTAPTPIETSTPPFVGAYRPVDLFSTLAGAPVKGDWSLSFLDATPGSGGTLYCWELEVTYEPPPTDLTAGDQGRPDPVKVGKKLTYTITAANAGPASASGVVVADTLPRGTTFLAAGPANAHCSRKARVECGVWSATFRPGNRCGSRSR